MERRAFLRMAGLATAGLALPGAALAAVDETGAFAAGLARYPWLAGWQDAPACDGRRQRLSVEGQLPAGLSGTLYRNGPGRFTRAGTRYHHWFDGDGLLQAWRVGSQGVTHQARFVATPKFVQEERAGRFTRQAIGTRIADAAPLRNSDDINTANTAVFEHAGELYALWEGGSAFELDADTLDSRGAKTWREDLRSVPFSAHPLRDRDGTLWNFGLSGSTLLVWHIGADGRLRDLRQVALPYPGYLHAFSMTDTHLAFVLLPYVPDGEMGERAYFETLQWQRQRGARALVLAKAELDRPRWFGLPAGAAYHFGPALQRGDELVLQACWNSNGAEVLSPFASEMRGLPRRIDTGASVTQIALNLRRGGVRVETLVAGAVDFPDWHPDHAGAMFALTTDGVSEHGYLDAVCAIDPQRGETARYRYGAGILAEEHRFVPAPDARRPGEGWLLGNVLDYRRGRTGLAVLDAENLAAGPMAMAWLPHTLPLGFHGWYVPASA